MQIAESFQDHNFTTPFVPLEPWPERGEEERQPSLWDLSKAMRLVTTSCFVIVFLMVPGGSDGCSWTTMAVDEDDEGEKDDSEADAVWRSPSMPLCFL